MQQDTNRVYNSPRQKLAWWMHFLKARLRNKEQARIDWLGQYIPAGGVIIDVGANFGYFAKAFSRLHGGSCRVYCFEPVSYNYSILSRVMRGYANATLEKLALSSSECDIEIHIPIKKSGRIGPALAHLGAEKQRDYIAETIHAVTLDAYVAQHAIPRLDFIKCDVEGAEKLVLEGGRQSLARHRPAIYCEISDAYSKRLGYSAKETFDLLGSLGYRAYWTASDHSRIAPVAGYEKVADYLFLHESKI